MSNQGSSFQFSRRFRISRQEGFSGLLQQKPQNNRWFAIYSLPNKLGCARIGLTVGKRYIPSAVQRNRVKRKIRECFRRLSRDGLEQDVIVRLRKPIDKSEQKQAFTLLSEMLEAALRNK